MKVEDAIQKRRAYRVFENEKVTDDAVKMLATAVSLAPSCFNNQPWRLVFVRDKKTLRKLHEALSEGNGWAKEAPMIVAVFSKQEDDCNIGERHYHQFDSGIAVGQMILQATELGLVAHPIAGYNPERARDILKIPGGYNIIALIIVGRHSQNIPEYFSENQRLGEKQRPPRKGLDEVLYVDEYGKTL
ncbi:MAG: nitroreductase family protein [Candidatus Altiarchaeota archaeon]|nr:nitroreductase family protein [Candidatus Altiarchaeota archaeon]